MRHARDHVLQVFEPAVGGVPVYVASLTEGLIECGWRVTVLARPNNSAIARLTACGASVVTMDMTKWPSPRTAVVIRTAIRLARQDVTVLHGHSTTASLITAVASRATGVPSVYSPHFWAFERDTHPALGRSMAAFERRMGRIHRHIIAVAEREQRDAARARIAAPIRIVPTGLADRLPAVSKQDARAMLNIAGDAPIALWVGRRAAQKRPQDLAPLAALLHAARIELVACGYGLRGSREGDGFVAAGGRLVDGLDTCVLYAAADIVVQTSAWESTPLTVLEAMRAGLPLVAYSVSGLADQVDNGVTGHLVEVGNVDQLARRVIALAASDADRTRLGGAARQRYEQRFSLKDMVDAIAQVYQSVRTAAFEDTGPPDRRATLG